MTSLNTNPMNKMIFLNSKDYSRKLYRVMGINDFFRIFETSQLSFSKPSSWDDKFENIFLNQNLLVGDEQIGIGFKDRFYGQCWSLCIESDAMWRLYGIDGCAAKISTRVPLLYKVLKDNYHFSYIGKVRYLTKDNLKKEVERFIENGEMNFIADSQAITSAKTLLAKLIAYKHEQEVRAIIFDADNKFGENTRVGLDIDPNKIIEQVTFGGPKLDSAKYEDLKKRLRQLGYKKRIIRSALYDMPNFSGRVLKK